MSFFLVSYVYLFQHILLCFLISLRCAIFYACLQVFSSLFVVRWLGLINPFFFHLILSTEFLEIESYFLGFEICISNYYFHWEVFYFYPAICYISYRPYGRLHLHVTPICKEKVTSLKEIVWRALKYSTSIISSGVPLITLKITSNYRCFI